MTVALLIIDLQNEFLCPHIGKFARKHVPVRVLVGHIEQAIAQAREQQAVVVWVTSVYEPSSVGSSASASQSYSSSEEVKKPAFRGGLLGLSCVTHIGRQSCCPRNDDRSRVFPAVRKLQDRAHDVMFEKYHYSAFEDGRLLTMLNERGITKIRLVGVHTNVCVLATAVAALPFFQRVGVVCTATAATSSRLHNLALETMRDRGVHLEHLALGAGDSFIHYGVSPMTSSTKPEHLLNAMVDETKWNAMEHKTGAVQRLLSIQSKKEPDGRVYVYRHPADIVPPTEPFSKRTQRLAQLCESICGHPLTHTLFQYYRSNTDFIGSHCDKTLDIALGSCIVTYNVGATRLLILRPKRDVLGYAVQRIYLPHDSIFVLGPNTNRLFTHAIRQDKRPSSEKEPDELMCGGQRLSHTFRLIATWNYPLQDPAHLFGQGAPKVMRPIHEDARLLLESFHTENRCSNFEWEVLYGNGSGVVDFSCVNQTRRQWLWSCITGTLSRTTTTMYNWLRFRGQPPSLHLYYVNGSIPSWRVQMLLYEFNVPFTQTRLKVMSKPKETRVASFLELNPRGLTPVLSVNASLHVNESLAILQYVTGTLLYGGVPTALVMSKMQESESLIQAFEPLESALYEVNHQVLSLKAMYVTLCIELRFWETRAAQTRYIADDHHISLADFAFYPILAYIQHRGFELADMGFPFLHQYTAMMSVRPSAQKAVPFGWHTPAKLNLYRRLKQVMTAVSHN